MFDGTAKVGVEDEVVEMEKKELMKPLTKEPLKPLTKKLTKPQAKEPVKFSTKELMKPKTKQPVKPQNKEPVAPSTEELVEPSTKKLTEAPTKKLMETPTKKLMEAPTTKLMRPQTKELIKPQFQEPIKPTSEEPLKPQPELTFRRSLSKHRQEADRTYSMQFDQNDILAALTASQEKINQDKPKVVHVHFAETPKVEQKIRFNEPSRDSDEVAKINSEMPWQKKHEYRTVTPFFKPQNKTKTRSNDDIPVDVAFRPIETSRSTEDVNIIKPVPIFASKSYQELPTSWEFKPFNDYQTRSSDDLLLGNIDGVRKPESKRHKLMRIRSTSNSNNSLNRLSDQLVYQNFHYDIPEVSASSENIMRKKAPQPLPRIVDESRDNKRQSKTIVYVLDKERDEFVLEKNEEEIYEDVLLHNNVDRYSDLTLFNSLVDSRDDCKFKSDLYAAGESHFNVQCFILRRC